MSLYRVNRRLRPIAAWFSGTRIQRNLLPLAVAAAMGLILLGSVSQAQLLWQGRKRPDSQTKKAGRPGNSPGSAVQPTAVFAKFPDWVASVAFSPDGKTLAAGSYGVVKLFDFAEHEERAALPEPNGFVKAVAFSADGKTLVAGSYQSLVMWDVAERTARAINP